MCEQSCLSKQQKIIETYGHLEGEALYLALMELGKKQQTLAPESKTVESKIEGCQSTAYIAVEFREENLFFSIEADALISAGLGQLLVQIYSGESPETILTSPPTCFEKIGLSRALSPSRSSGLAHMHLRLKKEALALLVAQ
jgi:cysteine desulfuration protein SufE